MEYNLYNSEWRFFLVMSWKQFEQVTINLINVSSWFKNILKIYDNIFLCHISEVVILLYYTILTTYILQ